MPAKIPQDAAALKMYILDRVVIVTESACWEWSGCKDKKGYGKLGIGGKSWLAHRLSYSVYFGDPGALLVCHKCDNPKCCNPDHLFLGSHLDNAADMVSKNRQATGFRNAKRKVSDSQIAEIIELYKTDMPAADIAKEYGISDKHVSKLARRFGLARGGGKAALKRWRNRGNERILQNSRADL